MYATEQIHLHLNNIVQFRLIRMKKIEEFFLSETNDRENMSKAINKYILALDYVGKTLLVSSGVSSSVSLFSFTTVTGTLVETTGTSISLVFLVINGIVIFILKTMRKKEKIIKKIT